MKGSICAAAYVLAVVAGLMFVAAEGDIKVHSGALMGTRRLHDHDHTAGDLEHDHAEAPGPASVMHTTSDSGTADFAPAGSSTGLITVSKYYGSYTIDEEDYGTLVEVEVTDTTRSIVSNSLPPYQTGRNPNGTTPYVIGEVINEYTMPLDPVTPFRGTPEELRVPGISIMGIVFEPATIEVATCEDGTEYNIEAVNNDFDVGLDPNGAHLRDIDGLYHYHTLPTQEFTLSAQAQDIAHVGFAFDSHMMYYSRSGVYMSSYVLSTTERPGGTCTYPGNERFDAYTLASMPDGSVSQDWVWTEGAGDLDECNGIEVDGEYAYFVTVEYPYVPRCLMGEQTAGEEEAGAGAAGGVRAAGGAGNAGAAGAAGAPTATADPDTAEATADTAPDSAAADAPSSGEDVVSATVTPFGSTNRRIHLVLCATGTLGFWSLALLI